MTYPGGTQPALDAISLRLVPGELVALTGVSGAGKSTLVALLLRLIDPDEGSVRLDGWDLRDLRLSAVRGTTGVMLQEGLVLNGSVADNVLHGAPGASADAVVGEKGRLLSGGQRQRLALSRALLRNPRILILDEPTAGLDEASTRALLRSLRDLVPDRTVLVVSHDPLVVDAADRVITLDHGRLVGDTLAGAAFGAGTPVAVRV